MKQVDIGMSKNGSGNKGSGDSIRKNVEMLKRQRLKENKVVSISEFRDVTPQAQLHRVLVVDDDEVMRAAMKRVLEAQGYVVVLAADGLELSKNLENATFDMILLDINLPWVDGYELCSLIKNHSVLGSVPLIMVSGNKDEESIEKGFEAGCDDYVTKPFEVDKLTNAIKEALLKTS
ncbi:response regulator [Oligoflexaceae bacterium]|nr:response regulator [Oligoflexaceae bacterium]